jgi:hypothetical protein
MASVIEAIREVLRPGVFEERALVLRETDPNSRCPEIVLSKRGKALMIRPDQVPPGGMSAVDRLFPLFDTSKPGLCQLCDYLVFYPRPQTTGEVADLFVFLFELKSGSAKGAMSQLRQGKLLADYVLEVAGLHGQGVRPPTVHYRGVTFVGAAPRPRLVPRYHAGFDWIDDPRLRELRVCSCRPMPSHDLDDLCL